MVDLLSLVVALIGIVLIPIIKFLAELSTRLSVLESQKNIYSDFHSEYRSDIDKLFNEIKELREEINRKAENYVSLNQCSGKSCNGQ